MELLLTGLQELPQAEKARLLGELATKIFAHAVSA